MKIQLNVVLISALIAATSGFSPRSAACHTPKTSLKSAAFSQVHPEHEDQAFYLLEKARECAYDDTCSIDDARHFLNEVVHIQSGCVAGTLAGHQLCEDQVDAADIVAHLRAKVDQAKDSGVRLWKINSDMALLYPEGNQAEGGVTTFGTALVILAFMLASVAVRDQGAADPFQPQEWYWALRDGYLPMMFSQYLKNGGLASVAAPGDFAVPFHPQEWYFAARDGYLPTMVSQFVKNGGLAPMGIADENAVPFTSQEWYWAMRDGYLPTMMQDYFRNGGL